MSQQGWLSKIFGKTFLSLRNRNFRLYFIGQLVSNTGNWLTNVALILLVLKITGSGFDVGLLTACQFGPVLFLTPWGGSIADRFDKRRLLIVTQSLEMLQSFGLAVLAFSHNPSITSIYILAIIGGILLAFDNPLRRSFVGEMVPSGDIPNAVVMYSTIVNVSRIFGPALAGLLVVTVGFGWCFIIDASSYIAVLIALFMMRPKELYRHPGKHQAKGNIREGLRYIFSIPVLWISFLMLLFIGTLSYNFNVTLPLFVTNGLHSSGEVFTILYSIYSLGAVICALVIAHRNLVGIRNVIYGAFLLGFSMILIAFVPNVSAAIPFVFLLGMVSILYMNATTALAQIEAKQEMHGRVLSIQTVLLIGTTLFGGPFSGWLADSFGSRAPFIFGGIICILSAIFGYMATKRYIPQAFSKSKILTESVLPPSED